jgi:TRAP-type uncharacterized transport system substrate-binding protein
LELSHARALPETIHIASGVSGGMYHSEISHLSRIFERQTGHRVVNLESKGSGDNLEMLESGDCHLALLQSGSDTFDKIKVLVPMYFEPVFVLVRKELCIGYDLRLMSVDETDDVPLAGKSMVIVAKIGVDMHIRIFNARGERVIDKPENELMSGQGLVYLRALLDLPTYPDDSTWLSTEKQVIINNAASAADYTIDTMSDLRGKVLAMGPEKSGTFDTAKRILEHYDLTWTAPGASESKEVLGEPRYFMDLEKDQRIDAAIVITGLLNAQLKELLSTGAYSLLPIDTGPAFCTRHHGFQPLIIPEGQFGPGLPDENINTVATTAVLAGRMDVTPPMVAETMKAIYELDFRRENPSFITAQAALEWDLYPLHPDARKYLDPAAGVGILANKLETLAATKELCFALIAILFLGYQRWIRLKEREQEAHILRLKDQLDELLDETIKLETDIPELIWHKFLIFKRSCICNHHIVAIHCIFIILL